MSEDERLDEPRDRVLFAANVARELEHIAEKGFVRTRSGDFQCSERARKKAQKAAPGWWAEADKRAEQEQRNKP